MKNIVAFVIITVLLSGMISTLHSVSATGLNSTQSNEGSNSDRIMHSETIRSHLPSNSSDTNSLGIFTTNNPMSLIMDNGNLDCNAIASKLDGTPLTIGKICDVVVLRQTPKITGTDGSELNQFTSMNNLIELLVLPNSQTSQQVLALGNFVLLDKEVNGVQSIAKNSGWTITKSSSPITTETPIMFIHWGAQGDVKDIIDQVNLAFAKTTIKGHMGR